MNNIPSADIEKCESLALNWMQSSLTLLSFANDIPLFIWQVHISPAGTNKSWVRMPQQFFLRHHGNQQQTFPPAFAQITPAYREALNLIQISPLLSFVLFYRVIEATNALRRPPTANDARIKQRIPDTWNDICHWLSESLNFSVVTVSGAHELVPEEAVGKKFSWIIENKLRPLRNVLAHGLINEPISTISNPKGAAPVFSSLDDTSFQKLVLTWLPLCQILARLALSEVGGLETGEFGEPLSLALKRRIDQEKLNAD
jgi:hypothetical protein